MRIPVITTKTAAETTTFDADHYSRVTFLVNGTLAGGESIAINVGTSSGFQPYRTSAGVAVAFAGTGNVIQFTLEGGMLYQFVKGVTGSACGIDAYVVDSSLTS